jgi:very-short-patch-repair endonuclease
MSDAESEQLNPEILRVVNAVRDVWISRLIDPSRSNSLLFYRDLKLGTLDLSSHTEAVGRLLRNEMLSVESLVSETQQATERSEESKSELQGNVRKALTAIQRKALGNREEKGIETLHLALGLATWPATDGGRPYDAPVLLFPAKIESRGRAGDEVRLSLTGEPQVNPVLIHMLEESFNIRIETAVIIKECGKEDEDGRWHIDQKRAFAILERLARTIPEFKVKDRAILANFQFAKMAMVEDLKKNGEAMAGSSVVAAIAGHKESRQKLGQAITDLESIHLDERPASDDYLVLDADSTQHRAVVVTLKGQNCVIQGPPGTGKSQTIANLIAQSVAEGRRVLFVAEKRAALDAVIKRLSHPEVGLDHLVLDLHGASVSRKEVMARLAHALDQIRQALPADSAEAVHRQFDARRKQLNEHAKRINIMRQPTRLSVNQMIGRLLRLPSEAKSAVRLRGEDLTRLSPEQVADVKDWLAQGSGNPTLLLGTATSPWNNAHITDGSRAQQAIDLAMKASSEYWPRLESLVTKLVEKTGVRPPDNLEQTRTLVKLLHDVRAVLEMYDSRIFSKNTAELAEALKPGVGSNLRNVWMFFTNSRYRCARRTLLSCRIAPVPVSTLRQESVFTADVLRRWRECGSSQETPSVYEGDEELAATLKILSEVVIELEAISGLGGLSEKSFATFGSLLTGLAGDQRTPYQLPGIHAVRKRIKEAGLAVILEDFLKNNVAPELWLDRFEYAWLYSALEQVLASDSALASFNGRTHEQLISEFIQLDRERVRFAADRVRRMHGERAVEAMNRHFDQANLVRAEASKKSRHIPLRELFARAPDVLTRIAPCWVASPLSVSQLLDGNKRHFDIVVFDEASQILQEEAIPALYRAEQVVVAGDRHQLPPTTFFATAVEGEDDLSQDEQPDKAAATAAIGGYESLLDTLEAFLLNCMLEWHYRSADERLIAFSNAHIYSSRLVTFPSAHGHEAIRHILVPHQPGIGGQEESASREVEEVVRQVLEHAATQPDETLGVITMGIKHANRIQAALDRALELRTELADFFSMDREERFFIKNLETVQGDERDSIILSVGYGKAADGYLPHRFGPLTQEVGYRRLNVAVTRAKRRMCVISSFSHHEIDLGRSGSRGVQLLKAYLEYAASGGERLVEVEQAGEVALNPFEADIRDVLERHSISIRPQFGASRYRIDLVAMHPKKKGRPVLAIECDGASYHSGATARDRDRLRQAHLQKLGWRFHRIWSTDWFYNREDEIQRVVAAYFEAVRIADVKDRDGEIDLSARTAPGPKPAPARERGPQPTVPDRSSIDDYSTNELYQIAEWVASDGLLRTDEQLIREMFACLPFQRMGDRIRRRLLTVVQGMRFRNTRKSSTAEGF